jgi:histidinol-phosphate phosphatase family protein
MTRATTTRYAVVVPTVARPSLVALLKSLAAQSGPLPEEVVVVDDRVCPEPPLRLPDEVRSRLPVRAVAGLGRGPAAARNLGWQLCEAPWISFLDDDVLLPEGWTEALAADLAAAAPDCGGIQGSLTVPLPRDRRPTDWERSTAGLERAQWATADMTYARAALAAVGGFDERFPRAYREDADLALRVRQAGWQLTRGRRRAVHPVRPADRAVSLRVQRGNADDALMRRVHGADWRTTAQTGSGRLALHAVTVGVAAAAAVGRAGGRSPRWRAAGWVAAAAWATLTADFAWRRIAPGPRDPSEVATMVWTSAAIPFAATWHRASGWWRHRAAGRWPSRPRAVLFDRDGTLVRDVPYNGDPRLVMPMPGAAAALAKARAHGLRTGVVSNQSGIARGLITPENVRAVNAVIDKELGPFDTWRVCPHGPHDRCDCRKPAPGLVRAAARDLGVRPQDCVVIGDIGADVLAARAAGAASILVPTPATRLEEVADAPRVAADLPAAIDLLVGGGHG